MFNTALNAFKRGLIGLLCRISSTGFNGLKSAINGIKHAVIICPVFDQNDRKRAFIRYRMIKRNTGRFKIITARFVACLRMPVKGHKRPKLNAGLLPVLSITNKALNGLIKGYYFKHSLFDVKLSRYRNDRPPNCTTLKP